MRLLSGQKTNERYYMLLEDIKRLKAHLDQVECVFNNVDDPDLIACCVHERTALHHRYNYLIRQVKAFERLPAAALKKETTVQKITAGSLEVFG